MRGIVIRWIVLTVAILAAAYLFDGIEVQGFFSALAAAAILGILNALLRPVLIVITLPLTVLTFGFFVLVINALMLMMASGVIGGLTVNGFWSALWGSVIISIVSGLMNWFVNGRGQVRVVDLRHRGQNRWE